MCDECITTETPRPRAGRVASVRAARSQERQALAVLSLAGQLISGWADDPTERIWALEHHYASALEQLRKLGCRPNVDRSRHTPGQLLRMAAELIDRATEAREPAGSESDFSVEDDEFGRRFTRDELYPHRLRDCPPVVCPLCGCDRVETTVEVWPCGSEVSVWMCDACGNDTERAKAVLERRRLDLRVMRFTT